MESNILVSLQTDPETQTELMLKEIEDAFFDIPFENSAFQTENFVIGAQITPERAYRAIGLALHSKIEAVRDCLVSMELVQFELEKLNDIINDEKSTKYDIRRAEIDIKKITTKQPFQKKLLNDAIVELNVLYKHFKSMPRYTREEFEAGERRHYFERLTRQVNNITGASESLINMDMDLPSILNFEKNYLELESSNKKSLLQQVTENSLNNLMLTKDIMRNRS